MVWCLNPDCESPQNPDGTEKCQNCDAKLIPLLRAHYRIISPLGGGGFGRTFLAEDTHKFNEPCVVKQLAPKLQGRKALRKATELFEQEAKRLQQLGKYPQIPTLHAHFEEEKYLFLVQELIEGQNLSEELDANGLWNESKIIDFLNDLLPILQTVHEHNVIHRDIKPSNLMRRLDDGKLVLIDFGVAKQVEVMGEPGTTIGTRGYAPIEQMDKGEAFPGSDLYSLGATCFFLLTNVSPQELWKRHGYSWVDNWQKHVPQNISFGFANILDKLLKYNHQERYQSALVVLEDLNSLSSLPPLPPLPPLLPQTPSISALLSQALIAGCGSSLLAIVIFSFFKSVWINAILWLLLLVISIFIQNRSNYDKINTFILAIITNCFIATIFQRLRQSDLLQPALNYWLFVFILIIIAGLVAFITLILSRFVYKIVSDRF
jgi:serine/threonine protein kinase